MSDKDDFGAFVFGFLVGGITGAVVALLFAPQTGEETRTMIKEKAIELRDKASETFDEAVTEAERAAKEAMHKAELLYNEAKAKAESLTLHKKVVLEAPKPKVVEVKTKKPTKSTTGA